MDFFVPDCDTSEDAEQVWDAIRQRVGGSDRRRIFRLAYEQRSYVYTAQVGEPERAVPIREDHRGRPTRPRRPAESGGEPVIAIYADEGRGCYLVCKPSRGVARDAPIIVGGSTVREVEDFREA